MENTVSFDRFVDLNYLKGTEIFKSEEEKIKEVSNKLLDEYKEIVLTQIINQFGIGQLIGGYKDGGNVSTEYNAKKGIFADEETKARYTREYKHSDYSNDIFSIDKSGQRILETPGLSTLNYQATKVREDIRNKITPVKNTPEYIRLKNTNPGVGEKSKRMVKASNNARKKIDKFKKNNLNKEGYLTDGYNTNRTAENHSNFHMDHVTSAKEIHEKFKLYTSKEEAAKIALDPNNITPTDGSANQSKGKNNLLEWNESKSKRDPEKTNGELYELDNEKVSERYKTSTEFIEKEYKKKKYKHIKKGVVNAGLKQGSNFALKQALGIFLYELGNEFSKEMKNYLGNLKSMKNFKEKTEEFKKSCEIIKDNLLEKKWKILKGFPEGFISGFISNIITFIINSFLTTYKRMVKIISESFSGLVSAVKTLFFNDFEDSNQKYKAAIKAFTGVIIGSLGGIMTESLILYLRTTPFGLFAIPVGSIIGGILTGIVTVSALYMIDDFSGFIKSLKGIFKKDEISQEELNQKYKELVIKMDEEYQFIIRRIYREYKHLLEITQKAFDRTISSTQRFNNTVEYAVAFKVDESEIVKNTQEIDDFFLN